MDFQKVKECIFDRMERELPKDLYYHKIGHSKDVLQAVERIADAENVREDEKILLQTSAILHDTGFLVQYHQNEPCGCDIAIKILPECGYKKEDMQTICKMIMATAIPQNPKSKLDEILCDADLDYLGRDDFYEISEELRKELKVHGKKFTGKEWLEFEIDFLEKHQYFTETSCKTREPLKQKHINELKNALKSI